MSPPSPVPISDDVASPVGRHPLSTQDEAEAIELRAEVNRRFAHRGWPVVADVESPAPGRLELVLRPLPTAAPEAPVRDSIALPPLQALAQAVEEVAAKLPPGEPRALILPACGMDPVRPGWCDSP